MTTLNPSARPARVPVALARFRNPRARWALAAGVLAVGGGVAASWWMSRPAATGPGQVRAHDDAPPRPVPDGGAQAVDPPVRFAADQQESIGMRTERVALAATPRVTTAQGRVAPNEYEYSFITPRAAGVVRTVSAHIGQEVKAGEILATIDSPDVGVARLDLYAKTQALEIARSQADRHALIDANIVDLIKHIKLGESPEQIHAAFDDRPVGANRERLMTAYAQYRLASATLDRNRDLFAQKLITPKDYEQIKANFEVAQATYQALLDELGYEVRLEHVRAEQTRKQAESEVRAAQERLRILGVKPDGTEPEVQDGLVVGVKPSPSRRVDPTPPPSSIAPEAILPEPAGPPQPNDRIEETSRQNWNNPVSTYCIWAPFDGTILDREMIVPGVAVGTTHRIFTLANLKDVWIEANVQESEFRILDRTRQRGGTLRIKTPAYPDRVFEGEVIYTGDLVDEKSRSVKLLAKANNPERLLRPGMFVEVEVLSPRTAEAVEVAESALLTDENRSFVYVKTGADRFARREVDAEAPRDGKVVVRKGLNVGEEVVVEGSYKLKALAAQLADAAG